MPLPAISTNAITKTALTETSRVSQAGTSQASSGAFGASLNSALNNLSQMQLSSDQAIQKLAAGQNSDLSQVMIGAEEADISFRVALSMRDKLVEAYQEVMRMQV